jgi:hypothetical protein
VSWPSLADSMDDINALNEALNPGRKHLQAIQRIALAVIIQAIKDWAAPVLTSEMVDANPNINKEDLRRDAWKWLALEEPQYCRGRFRGYNYCLDWWCEIADLDANRLRKALNNPGFRTIFLRQYNGHLRGTGRLS